MSEQSATKGVPPELDVRVSGQWGLYAIRPETPKGRRWRKRHLSGGERTVINGATICEGSREIREIVAAMVADGLTVTVNGVDMTGFRVAS